jgi:autotransporter translocation and assembly factor TamB
VQLDLGRDFRIQGKGIDTRLRGTLALNGETLRDPRLTAPSTPRAANTAPTASA